MQAEESGVIMSDFVRDLVRARVGIGVVRKRKKECRELALQVAKVGNNVNQIAKWVNKHKSAADVTRVILFLAQVVSEMKKISARVMGG